MALSADILANAASDTLVQLMQLVRQMRKVAASPSIVPAKKIWISQIP